MDWSRVFLFSAQICLLFGFWCSFSAWFIPPNNLRGKLTLLAQAAGFIYLSIIMNLVVAGFLLNNYAEIIGCIIEALFLSVIFLFNLLLIRKIIK